MISQSGIQNPDATSLCNLVLLHYNISSPTTSTSSQVPIASSTASPPSGTSQGNNSEGFQSSQESSGISPNAEFSNTQPGDISIFFLMCRQRYCHAFQPCPSNRYHRCKCGRGSCWYLSSIGNHFWCPVLQKTGKLKDFGDR